LYVFKQLNVNAADLYSTKELKTKHNVYYVFIMYLFSNAQNYVKCT